MPWPFGPPVLDDTADAMNRQGRRRAKWRGRRGKPGSEARALPVAPVLFESYEPRLLLSGAPVPVGTVLASSTGAVSFQDADGTTVTAALSGPGSWQFIQGTLCAELTVSGTDATSKFSISGKGGDGRVALEAITLQGPLASFTASTTDVIDSIALSGAVQKIVLGNVRDTVLTATAAIGSLEVTSWQAGGLVANRIDGQSIGSLVSQGQLNLDLNLSATGVALGSVLAGGALSGGTWQVAGDVGSIAARSVGAGWTGDIAGETGVVQTDGSFGGTLATRALQVAAVGGGLLGGRMYIGAELGSDGRLGGSGAAADSFGVGFLGQLRVAGSMIGAKVYVGVNPTNGSFDDGDDTIVGGAASRIQAVLVGGRVDSTSRIVAGGLPATLQIGGAKVAPGSSPRRFATTPSDVTRPSVTVGLVNDTGGNASDGITSDASMAGSVSDAGGLADLRVGLDATPVDKFTSYILQVQPDGSFSLSKAELDTLAGGKLADGKHVLRLVAIDKTGNARSSELGFTLNNTQVTAALVNDTGISSTDGYTTDVAFAGQVVSAVGASGLKASLDKGAAIAVTLGVDGKFSLSKAQVDALAGGKLAEGTHTLSLSATDKTGVVSPLDVAFTYDVTAPAVSKFGLTASSDTGTLGDNITAAARVGLVGVTEAGATATLGGVKALASGSGAFQFADIVLANGDNKLSVTVADLAGNVGSGVITINRSGTITTDAALTWNQATLEAIRKTSMYPEVGARIMAMVGLAQFDTLAAIEGTASYLVKQTAVGPTDTGLALAKAAHTVLYALFPTQRADLDAILDTATNAVPVGAARTNALALGQSIAQAILDIRAADGSGNFVEYVGSNEPGKWRPTAPMFTVAEEPQWAEVVPFALTSPDQFQAPPPPDLTSGEYAAALNEVKLLGTATGSTRTTDQTEQAQFWADGRGSYTPAGHWNAIAQQVATAQGNSLAANVRLFAQLNVALADAAIAAWNTKFAYNTWRPIDAIQNADLDDNGGTAKDAAWNSLLIAPPHPEYVSGHSTFSAAAAGVLSAVFGNAVNFTTNSFTLPGVSRSFSSFDQAADEAGRSRIYGGIHFEFSNEAGKTIGGQVAAAVLARFNLAQDTQGPAVVMAITPVVTGKNLAVTGQVLDNLSGVASARFAVDGGAFQDLKLDAQGKYSFSTALALDGSADGSHSVTIAAKDVAGNAAKTFVRKFTLDTKAPNLTLSSLAEGASLTTASRVTGTADPTGSTLRGLTYTIDKGKAVSLAFDGTTGGFDAGLVLGNLDIGKHTLTIAATDAAGNTATLVRNVTLAALNPFTVTSISPNNGATEVGSTQRPEVRFSRAVKLDTLTDASFYATGPTGEKLAATIVPAQDGSYAWLFLDAPMPGGATITVHVDGSLIRAAADGVFLDADANGSPGDKRTFSFTTVSLTPVAGTTLRGRVVDPGPDLEPMTFDDIRRGPDGVIHTADDVFLLPIVHAKVYILGQEDKFVFTDANGNFELTNLPAGNVKVAIDGRTATNPPAGVFFPEMVMDADLKPGVLNTVMDSMGTAEERAANAGRVEVYLPRVQNTIFSVVSDTAPTTVGVDQATAPNLTDAQRNSLKLTVDPGSVIGADGKAITDAQIGISTVPPELVRDMLPPGVLQHTFDITIQAPGAATFATPATITFPNVFNAAPGTKLNILSFDHTTGMLVINGTATVSEDGLTVVSDEGAGVRAPGWHGITPPGDCGVGGDPPKPEAPPAPTNTTSKSIVTVPLMVGNGSSLSLSWDAPAKLPDTPPPPPPDPNCPTPPPPADPPGKKQPFTTVSISVDGPLSQFMKKTGDVAIGGGSFTLTAGSGTKRTYSITGKTLAELLPGGWKTLNENLLYGSSINVTTVNGLADGSTDTKITTYYLYRFVDATDDTHDDGTMSFAQTLNDGTGNVVRRNPLKIMAGGAAPDVSVSDVTNFSINGAHTEVRFDPSEVGGSLTSDLVIKNPVDGKSAGVIDLQGKGVKEQLFYIDPISFDDQLTRLASGKGYVGIDATEKAIVDSKAERDALFTAIATRTSSIFSDAGLGNAIKLTNSNAGDNVLTITFKDEVNPANNNGSWTLGYSVTALGSPDIELDTLVALGNKTNAYSKNELAYRVAGNINNVLSGQIEMYVDNYFESATISSADALTKILAKTFSHEIGHYLGLFHPGFLADVYIPGGDGDILLQGIDYSGTTKFSLTKPAATIAAHIDYTATTVTKALEYYVGYAKAVKDNVNWGGDSTFGEGDKDTAPVPQPFTVPTLAARDATGFSPPAILDLGDVVLDGIGGKSVNTTLSLINAGVGTVEIASIKLSATGDAIAIDTSKVGKSIGVTDAMTVGIAFDPQAAGKFERQLTVTTTLGQVYELTIAGRGITAGPSLHFEVLQNNLGGVAVAGGSVSQSEVLRITNDGAAALTITGISLTEGAGEFSLTGYKAGSVVTLAQDESLVLGGSFDASTLGLRRARIEVASNDASQPVAIASMVGTGMATYAAAKWGEDFVGLTTQGKGGDNTLHAVSDKSGKFSFFLPSSTPYSIGVFDPATGLVANGTGTTSPPGKGTNLSAGLSFKASTAIDSDFDGLPDDIEFAIGTNDRGGDTDNDGLSDFTEIQQGLDPLGGLGLPTGIVSAATLQGSAQSVAVVGSTADPTLLTAFVATGTHGLAVVDVSKLGSPSVLAELNLAGDNSRVAVDQARGIALVAAGSSGLHFVDVSNPSAPTLLRTESFTAPVTAVVLRDGIAYAAAGKNLYSLDVASGEPRQTIDLSAVGGSVLRDVVMVDDTLFTLDTGSTLRTISLDGDAFTIRGSITLSGVTRLTVGNGVAYVASGLSAVGGYLTVDVSNLDALVLLSGIDNNSLAGSALALNGSGLGVVVGGSNGAFGGAFKGVDLVDVSDSSNTGAFLTRITLPDFGQDVMIANGLAFVAAGGAGLQVVNYRSFDTKGVAPTVKISIDAIDADAKTAGVQILEGRSIHVVPTVADDVQVRNVELLLNGKVVVNDPSFPFDLFTQAPSIAASGGTVTLQVRATDTGGNSTVSAPVTFAVVKDIFPPVAKSISVDEGSKRFFVRSIDVVFDEPLDLALLKSSGVTLARAGADGKFGTADDVSVPIAVNTRSLGQIVSAVPVSDLIAGDYQFRIDAAVAADIAGNKLAAPLVRNFVIRPASDVKAASGTPEVAQQPSANPGQQIGIAVPFDPTTARMTFVTVDSNGTKSTVEVKASGVNAPQNVAFFNVPYAAVTGDVVVFGQVGAVKTDFADGKFLLQVVPVVNGVQVNGLGTGNATVTLSGFGFIEGADTTYRFGKVELVDASVSAGPNVFEASPNFDANNAVSLSLPLGDDAFGPITVTTAGGTSAAFTVGLTGVVGQALSGTAANAAIASANPGQAVTLLGTGLSLTTDVLVRYRESGGATVQTVSVSPTDVSADGTKATLVVPFNANDVFALQTLGSDAQPLLQIVPLLNTYDISGGTLYLTGAGFVEGSTSVKFKGGSVQDTKTNGEADIYFATTADNTGIYFSEPVHGLGPVSITTAGGTSATIELNEINPGIGYLRDVAVDAKTGTVWLADNASPGMVRSIDLATGLALKSFEISTKDFGSTNFFGGMQIVPAAFTLGSKQVDPGSLLMFNGQPSPDRVVAVNPTSGAVISVLALAGNYDLSSGVYDPVSGNLFVIDRSVGPNRFLELNPTTGEVVSSFTAPFNAGESGLALDPVTGNLWYGSDQSNTLVELSRTGTVLRSLALNLQGIDNNEVTGLAFDGAGKLVVSSTQGRVYIVDPARDFGVVAPTLTAINSVARTGTAASAGQASANAGQVVELVGSNFGAGTEVIFTTRDNTGTIGRVAATPLAISGDGTRLQVLVPHLASSGDAKVSNVGSRNLGFNSFPDSIHRQLTAKFTATGASTIIRFADGGLQVNGDETWGIDNVRVTQGATTLFADDFEGAASKQWSSNAVSTSTAGAFTRFAGPFSSQEQRLTLNGLVAGQSYTLSFDLYAIDSWDGDNTANGPDVFQVQADGVVLLRHSVSHTTGNSQTINNSAGVRLQVVPTVTGTESGGPGSDSDFVLTGSGFMEGASTITIGGIALVDSFTNLPTFDVYGNNKNDRYNIVAPLTLEGPIRVTTDGGYAEIAGPTLGRSTAQEFSGIVATATSGTPTQLGAASANAGQTITLQGRGFTFNTQVQFEGVDDTGRVGVLTRTGNANAAGTELTVQVPELARTGTVRVLGSTIGQRLQVVPTLRSIGGTVAAGNTVLIEATGLVQSEVVVQVDGRAIGDFTLRTISDSTNTGAGSYTAASNQQILTVVLPSNVANAVVSVSTAGGTALLRTGVAPIAVTQTATTDGSDTIAQATVLTIPGAQVLTLNGVLGDNPPAASDVDLYALALNRGDVITLGASGAGARLLRLFGEDAKQQFSASFSASGGSFRQYDVPATGTYYLGISTNNNFSYNPTIADSGTNLGVAGAYQVTIERTAASDTRLQRIEATAARGSAAQSGVAAANVGQTITLYGAGLTASDVVLFTNVDSGGRYGSESVAPTQVAADGSSLTVLVPNRATTGMVRLQRDRVGVLLQVVPTLDSADITTKQPFEGGSLTLVGTGFIEGSSAVRFGATVLTDTARFSGLDIFGGGLGKFVDNSRISTNVPLGVSTGPLRVTTVGGTSDTLQRSLSGVVATAESGAPANAGIASANPGQSVQINGAGLGLDTVVIFETLISNGVRGQTTIRPWAVNDTGTQVQVLVPLTAVSGTVRVLGDTTASALALQIVPRVTDVQITGVAGDGSSVTVRLTGRGFIEGSNSEYRFANVTVYDGNAATGPDVFEGDPLFESNGTVQLTLPIDDAAFGPITVKTAGGTSAAFSLGFTGVVGTALSGTAANSAIASANPGQAVQITGSGLSTATDVLLRYVDSGGTPRLAQISPVAAAANGTSATVIIPLFANGAFDLRIVGATGSHQLQIVPTVTGYDASGGTFYTTGSGFVEGAMSFSFLGAKVVDDKTNDGTDIYFAGGADNTGAYLPEPLHGLGGFSVTTAGGTSASFSLNEFVPGLGYLRDVAFDGKAGSIWIADNGSPAKISRIDTATGKAVGSIEFTTKGLGTTSFFGGLQFAPADFTLNATKVPAGSLLVFNGITNTDSVYAVDIVSGTTLASLSLSTNYDLTAGVFDPISKHLFVIDRRQGPNRFVEIDPTSGAEIASFNAPFNAGEAGLAIDPVTGNLWYGSDQSNMLVEMTRSGTVLRTLNIAVQGVDNNEVTGLAFNAAGKLVVSSTQGRVFIVDPAADASAARPTLTAIVGSALAGTATDISKAAANVGQVIDLVGSNFGAGTRVVFQTRDGLGNIGSTAIAPLAISTDGTRLQVIVPDLATTAEVKVTNAGTRNLGFVGYTDSIYRNITLTFTADDPTTVIRFNDGGIETIDNESWGLDNVRVTKGGTTIFVDNFETGASKQWSDGRVDESNAGIFSRFSGRFANEQQLLTLNGLTAGQSYTLTFDLYAIDSWDGNAGSQGPDVFQVSADGVVLMRDTISNSNLAQPQTINSSVGMRLQIVPTLQGTDGRPGTDQSFTLNGSGFMEGANTITIGGVVVADSFKFTKIVVPTDVSGTRNGNLTVTAPLVLDGKIRVTTEGGFSEIADWTRPATSPSLFTAIQTPGLLGGTAAGGGAAANAGQVITLVGQGFTSSTQVRFQAVDDTGQAGTITRGGSANAAGTSFTVQVPELARSGVVEVLGASGGVSLNVVPLLRGIGGTLTAGNTVLLEGTGLVRSELAVKVDGKAVTGLALRTIADSGTGFGTQKESGVQQLLSFTVPVGVGPGVVTITTAGGTNTLRQIVGSTLPSLTPAVEVGDTLATSLVLAVDSGQSQTVNAEIGGPVSPLDVDMYRINLSVNETINLGMTGPGQTHVRIFDDKGAELLTAYAPTTGAPLISYRATSTGTYYVGVSGYSNFAYDPTKADSGGFGFSTGKYGMSVTVSSIGETQVASIAAIASTGTPAMGLVASANPGQTIILKGTGLLGSDEVIFTTINSSGIFGTATVKTSGVAVDGIAVVVPNEATTGTVRLARENVGVVLQVVPILETVSVPTNGAFTDTFATLTGRGFSEGLNTIRFGGVSYVDPSRSVGSSVSGANVRLDVPVPKGAAGGPISVTTVGGTSNVFDLTFTGITAVASSGTPTDAGKDSANPGQTITITGTKFSTGMDVVFQTYDSNGRRGHIVVSPTTVNAAGTSAEVVVPDAAVTGVVRIFGDSEGTEAFLQVVPVLTALDITSVSSSDMTAAITLSGRGFIDAAGTQYVFGSSLIEDPGPGGGPDVYQGSPNFRQNDTVNLTLPLAAGSFGPVTVRTAGGVSAPYTLSLTSITATATSGTPANPAQASANPGQTITLNGTGLTTTTDVLLRYRESGSGALRIVSLNPATATADGVSATLVVPNYANAAFALQVLGSSSQPLLQIVPVVTGYDVSGSTIYLRGFGFLEGAASYDFAGATVTDTSGTTGPDVYFATTADSTGVYFSEPQHGLGNLTVTTAGGTSAAFALNETTLPLGYLRDIAVDTATGAVWVIDNANPAKIHRINLATGEDLQTIDVGAAGWGSTSFFGGLHVVTEAFNLNGTTVPVGSLLAFNGAPNVDRVVAVNASTGAVIASLALANYDTTAGVFDPTSNHLFVLDRRTSPNKIVEIDPANGAEIASFNPPFNSGEAGLAIDPITGNLWYGSDQSNNVVELTRAGVVVRTVSLASQGVDNNEVSGLAFDATGRLLVASTQGRVYRVTV